MIHLTLKFFPNVFNQIKKQKSFAGHSVYKWKTTTIVSPHTNVFDALTPKNLSLLKAELKETQCIIIDLVKTDDPVVQIVDHINESGKNTLIGRTPYRALPKFPDMSKLYNKKDFGYPQKILRCLGLDRYNKLKENGTSQMVAFISQPAHYVGWKVTALGWDKDKDPTGNSLRKAISCLI